MQVAYRPMFGLLAVSLSIWVASCALNDSGLGGMDAGSPRADAGAMTGAAGSASTGQAGSGSTSGAAGDGAAGTDPTGGAGTSGAAGTDSTGAAGDGAAGTDPTGRAGTNGAAGFVGSAGGAGGPGVAGANGTGAAGTAAPGTGAAGTFGTAVGQPGCSDGTREGYLDRTKHPRIAACSGAWEDPGLVSLDSRVPQCDRRAGNDGDRADGRGCSVADLCASGWHVCTGAKEVATLGISCADAVAPFGDSPVYFVTRQRATGLVCDDNGSGTNNLYGCGTIGTPADKSCAPFPTALRDSDCQNNFPWVCTFGPIGTSQEELNVVVKRSTSRGGVLCCRD